MPVPVAEAEIEQQLFTPEMPMAFLVPETETDVVVRQRAARFIGACLADNEIDLVVSESLEVRPIESLYDAIQLAAEGDPMAYDMVQTNVRTDVIERTIKAGHVIKVDLHVNEAGIIQQHGQSMESVQANSLRLASSMWQMRERTEAEATNAFRIKEYYDQGELEDYSFVVFSRAADNMTEDEMDKVGFFTDTMSCAIQVTTAKDGKLTTESAFVAGTKYPGAKRHDADTVVSVGEELGVDLSGKTAAEIINTPILVHNSLIPNGAIDLVEMWDDAAGGTFFGEDKPPEDYCQYREKCKQREEDLQPTVNNIVEELIDEAPEIDSRLKAVQRLHKLSEKHMVKRAVHDHTINPLVFGEEAAEYIVDARYYQSVGDWESAAEATHMAQQTADSKSCPGVIFGQDNPLISSEAAMYDHDQYGSLVFECPNGHINTREHGELVEECSTCHASVKC